MSSISKVPTLAALLGYEIAARPMHYHEMVACLTALCATSDRAVLSHYGETPTGRRLYRLIISSPRNLSRLAEIDEGLRSLGDDGLDEQAARELARELPAVAWMGYGIHGDEVSGTDTAVELVHRLLSGDDAETRELLEKLVIHVDPMVNPDGRERCLAHHIAYARAMPAQDAQDIFHNQFWPEGRGNHYLFDLNRDALFMVQRHSRERVAAIVSARPQVYVDAHEMAATDTYLFAVPAEPLNPHLPQAVHESWRDFGADHGEALDRAGTSYYTRSWNEVFYPGFFDIWPSYHGAVPILYEQSATCGAAVRMPNGKLRTYREAVSNQLLSSITNLKTAAAKKSELLHRWWQSRATAAKGAGVAQAWLIPPADAYKQQRLRELLATQGIRCERLAKPVEAEDLHSPWEAGGKRLTLPAGTLLVRAAQPLGALVRNLFDFHVPLGAEFLKRERQGIDLGVKTLLFDATAWSLPLAFGIDAFWSGRVPKGDWQAVASDAGAKAAAAKKAPGRFGYLYTDPALRATAQLLRSGIQVRVAREAFVHDGVRYEPGTFLIRRDDQERLDIGTLDEVRSSAPGTTFVAVEGARMPEGPDLGGGEFALLSTPSIAIVTGAGSNGPNSGALWHVFDVEVGVPVTLLEFSRLGAVDLAPYNVIVLADPADRSALVAGLRHGRLEQLRHWVHNGGTLIGLSGSALALAEAGLTASKPRGEVIEQYPPLALGRPATSALAEDFSSAAGCATLDLPSAATTSKLRSPVVAPGARAFVPDADETFAFPARPATSEEWLEGVPRASGMQVALGELLRKYLPRGAYLRADLKPQHWLRYGVADRLATLFREGDALIVPAGAADIVGRYAPPRDLALSGLVWPEAVGYVAGTAYLVRERMGHGQVVLFANDPVFRGYSLGTQRLFLNAALLGPAFRSA